MGRSANLGTLFGQRFRENRERLGVTGYMVAHATGISTANLTSIEKGRRPPSPANLKAFAEVPELGLTLDVLQAWADADKIGVDGLRRIKAHTPDVLEGPAAKHNNDARLRQLHENKILHNSLINMSDTGMSNPAGSNQAGGTRKLGEIVHPHDVVEVPLYGPAACGPPPSWSLEDAQEKTYVPRYVLEKTGAVAVFLVVGDSMSAERINDGDEVLVRPYAGHEKPRPGHTVIVQTEGGYVCKKYQKNLLGEYLESRYEGRDPEPWMPADDAKIVGRVLGGFWYMGD